jgi:hypothetical protein
MRIRPAWCIALVAALLNLVAPALAYEIGQPLHDLAPGEPGGGAGAVAAHAHHGGIHAHPMHGAHHAAPADPPTAPHCPYCFDFAAGAALGTTVPIAATAQDGHPPLGASALPRVSARPSLRLASPRGPPLAG